MRKIRQRDRPQHQRSSVDVDIESLPSLENRCASCEVCATTAEVKRIIKVMPAAAKYCPHLLTAGGHDNVFDEEEPGLFSIDTTEDGLREVRAHRPPQLQSPSIAKKKRRSRLRTFPSLARI